MTNQSKYNKDITSKTINTLCNLFLGKNLDVALAGDVISLSLKGGRFFYKKYNNEVTYSPRDSYVLASTLRTDWMSEKISNCKSREEVLTLLSWAEFIPLLDSTQSNRYASDDIDKEKFF